MDTMIIYHNNSSVSTIKELMEYKHIFETDDFTYKTFFDENRTNILQQLDNEYRCKLAEEKYGKDAYPDDLKESDLDYEMKLPFPCTLFIKVKYVTTNLKISETNLQVNTDNFYAFESEQISAIENNEYYVINRSTKKQKPDAKVFGWFKSYYYAGTLEKTGIFYRSDKARFLDISKYIQDISTNVTQAGGSFRITLPMINSNQKVKTDLFSYSKNNDIFNDLFDFIREYVAEEVNSFEFGDSFFHKSTVKDFNKTLFDWMIQCNDLIFISFGDDIQEMEEDIGMRCFDMIGLVDDVSVSQNSNGTGQVVVTGRDLMKLIQEDSSLFFNKATAWGGSNIFTNTESYEKSGDILSADMRGGEVSPVDRLRRYNTNEINIFAYYKQTIDFIIKGVIQKLTNIEIVPDYVFEAWGNRRTRFNEFEYVESEGGVEGSGQQGNEGNANDNQEIQRDEELNVNPNINANKRPKKETDVRDVINNSMNGGGNIEEPSTPVRLLPYTDTPNGENGWIRIEMGGTQ